MLTLTMNESPKFSEDTVAPSHTHLVLAGVLHDLLVDDLIHDLEAFDGLLLRDAHVGLLQGHGPETTNK